MSRLTTLSTNQPLSSNTYNDDNPLVEALQLTIEMIRGNALTPSEIAILDEVINFVATSDDQLNEKKMSAQAKMAARKYRLKHRARLELIAKKKKTCMARIAGKTDVLACGSNGLPHRINKLRSKASRLGAKSR